MEIWKDIIGYEGIYQISNLGNVKSLDRVTERPGLRGNMKRKGQYLKINTDTAGYFSVNLSHKIHRIHRLLAIHFLDRIEGKNIVNHIDKNRKNNNLENLEWCTILENNIHGIDYSKTLSGLTGVTLHKPTGLWMAQINYNKKYKNLGYFKTKEDAYSARCNFEKNHGIQNRYL